MAAKKKPVRGNPTTARARRLAAFISGPGRSASLVLLVVVCFVGCILLMWDRVRDHVLSRNEYYFSKENLVLTPPPAWIHNHDLKTEVLRDAGLGSTTSLLEPDLAERIAKAFRLNPWIERVEGVRIEHPGKVKVDVSYRQPLAVVLAPGGSPEPVDAGGVWLPKEDFSAAELKGYPRIILTMGGLPPCLVGTRCNEPRLLGAIEIIKFLGADWQKLGFKDVQPPSGRGGRSRNEGVYELYAREGAQIIWGSPPGGERSGEIKAEEKRVLLRDYVALHGSLDAPTPKQVIDVTQAKLNVGPTAQRPEVDPTR